MKKTYLALSLGIILSIGQPCYAESEDTSASAYADASMGEHVHSEPDAEESSQSFRADVERLYPQYFKIDADDSLYSQFVEDYKNRQFWTKYFTRSAQYLNLYKTTLSNTQARKIDPSLSKLDAMLYSDLTQINLEFAQIQKALSPYVEFNQVILNNIQIDQPYPLFNDEQGSNYRYALNDMKEVQEKQQEKLLQLTKHIDQYQEKLDEFGSIVSKRVRKQHQENINYLNQQALAVGHYLTANIKAYDAFIATYHELDNYDAEHAPSYAKQYQRAAQTEANIKKVKALLAVIPSEQEAQQKSSALEQEMDQLKGATSYCSYLWRGDDFSEIAYYVEKLKQQFLNECAERKTEVRKFYDQHVFVAPVPSQIAPIQNMNSMADFKRYGDDLYYTETEKNAVYRFNLKSLKEELIYEHRLPREEDGCDHNMCRGVGATDLVLSHDGKTAYVTSLDYDQVFAIDLATQQVVQKFAVGRYPRKILLDAKGSNLYVYNGVGNSISRIQLKSGNIKTVALPDNYQEHFCREIGMSFEPDQKAIRILGDWSDHPYIYMNTDNFSFYELNYDIPEKVLYQVDPYRSVVEFYHDSTIQIGIYDIRVAQAVNLILVEEDAFKEKDPDSDTYVYHRYQDLASKTQPVLMGYLGDDYLYYVEQANFSRFDDLNTAFKAENLDLYLLNLVDQRQQDSEKVTLKLPSKPAKVELLENGKILILLERGYIDDASVPAQVMIIDPKESNTQQILESNKSKLLSHSKLDVIDLYSKE